MTNRASSKRSLHETTCEEVESALEQEFAPQLTHKIPWIMLKRLVHYHSSNLNSALYDDLLQVISQQDVDGYFQLQKWNDPTGYGSSAEYFAATSVLSFLKKFPFGKVASLDPLATAVGRFYEAETLCKIANRRIKWYSARGFRLQKHRPGLYGVIHAARQRISRWLGPLDLNKIHDYMRHGPGGSIGCTGDETTAYFKYAACPYTVSVKARPYAEAAILTDPLWRRYVASHDLIGGPVPTVEDSKQRVVDSLKVTNYNKVTFVPKTAKTHRAIAIEPLMNIYTQLGVGDFLRDCLKAVGMNLRSQGRNQALARLGSLKWSEPGNYPVTLDMSMASDTMCYELVRTLLPEEWFNFLCDLRSEFGTLDGKEFFRWAKFSSMGNGFTFQLESMIFYALALSVFELRKLQDGEVAVYGDDIVVPRDMALQLIEVLNFCGFKVNTDKSFVFGPFRESCGEDYYGGTGVRPIFLKKEIKKRRDLLYLINVYGGLYEEHPVSQGALELLPNVVKTNLLGPRTEDLEGHIHAPLDSASKSCLVLWERDLWTWSYRSSKAIVREIKSWMACPLYLQLMDGASSRATRDVEEREATYYADPSFWASRLALTSSRWLSEKVVRSQVTARNRVKYLLLTQTSNGWRNC